MYRTKNLIIIYVLFICFFSFFPQTISAAENIEQIESEAEITSKIWDKNSLLKSFGLFTDAGSLRIQTDNLQKAAINLLKAGDIQIILGSKTESGFLFRKALDLSVKANYHEGQIISLGKLALIELENGNFKNSKNYLTKADKLVEISTDLTAKSFLSFVNSEYFYYQRDIPNSITSLKKAVEFAHQSGVIEDEAKYLLNLGYAYMANEDINDCLVSLNLSLEKWKSINNARGLAFNYIALGHALSNYGEKQKSLDYYRLAENLFPHDIDLLEKARLFNGIGKNYEDFGEWEISLNYRRKALELFKRANHKFGQSATLPSIAILSALIDKEDNSAILNNYHAALEMAKSVDDQFNYSAIEAELGNYYFQLNEFDKALTHYEKALSYFQELKVDREIPLIKTKIAQILMKRNRLALANGYLFEALELNQKVKNKFSESDTLFNIASLHLIENNNELALKELNKSIEIAETLYADVSNSKLKSTYFSSIYDHYELYINILMKIHRQFPEEKFDIEALRTSEKSRARSMLENLKLSEANFMKDANSETVKREKEIRNVLSAKADKLTDALSRNTDKAEIEKLSGDILELEHELEQIKADLKQNSPLYSAIKNPAPFDVNEFQANVLDEKTLLLEFSLGAEESYLWIVGKNEVNSVTLPKREILESRIQKLLDLLKAREISADEEPENYQKRLIDAESEFESEARLLSNELFGQIADKITGKRLIIVPDGKLYYFPISALPLPNAADNEPMLQTNEIVYEPSAATLQILGKSKRPEKLSSKELLVFADPIFSLQDNRLLGENKPSAVENDTAFLGSSLRSFNLTDSNNQLARLFATQQEANSIAEIVGVSNTTIASGFAANRQRVFEKDVSDYKIIHFATHGLMNETRPELSGVVLSLFDEKGEAQKGFIRLQDIYSLDLSADLVVLSACQSGIGKEVKGEGLMSLTGGFIQSGANSVLSSLWKVDDYATAELMKNFYQELSTNNLAPSQALRNAQIKMRQNPNFKSPFYWAAFTVQGEFRQPIGIRANRFSYLWIVLAVSFVGLVIYSFVRFVRAR